MNSGENLTQECRAKELFLFLILTFVAEKGGVAYGTSLLFVYAIGHCALIFLAGTATGFAESFIRSKGFPTLQPGGKELED